MTARRDPDILIQAFLEEGQAELPDRAYDAVRAEIDHTRQRVVIGPWRLPNMSNIGRFAMAAAAVLVVAVAGVIFLSRPGGVAGPGPTASPPVAPSAVPTGASTPATSATPQASSFPSPSAPALVSYGSVQFRPAFQFKAPRNWVKVDETTDYYVIGTGTPDAVVLQANPIIATDANECEGLAAPGGATTVDGFMTAFSGDSRILTTTPQPVTIGEYEGQTIDIQLDPAWIGTCTWSGGRPAGLILTTQTPPGPFLGLIASERVRLILLDVGDDVVAIAIDSSDGSTFDAFTAVTMPVIESFQFTP